MGKLAGERSRSAWSSWKETAQSSISPRTKGTSSALPNQPVEPVESVVCGQNVPAVTGTIRREGDTAHPAGEFPRGHRVRTRAQGRSDPAKRHKHR